MTLSSMVVSRDLPEISVLECILGGLHMDVAVESEPQRAMARLDKSKIDALIVDCDLSGSTRFLRELQCTEKRSNTVPLVIMGTTCCPRSLEATGALFAFEKPISVEQAVRTLSAARNMILDGRLRYYRAGLDVPVSLGCKSRKPMGAFLVNVSQGGMKIHTDDPVETSKPLQVSFALPGARGAVRANTEVVWNDHRGNLGVRFLELAPRQQRALRLWLAQRYFAN